MRAHSYPLVVGHRGAPGYRPEHTRAAYELAFALGADAVEPDLVATRDGVLVLRHENDISETTDVAAHPEFADRRTTKEIDGVVLTGWFTEDFTWAELSTLRARERVPSLRQTSASFDRRYPLLRFRDLVDIVDRASDDAARLLGIVAELKHATYFESIGLPLDELVDAELSETGWGDNPELIVESFEKTVLAKLYHRGYRGAGSTSSSRPVRRPTGSPRRALTPQATTRTSPLSDSTRSVPRKRRTGSKGSVSTSRWCSPRSRWTRTATRPRSSSTPRTPRVSGCSAGRCDRRTTSFPQAFRRGESDSAWGDWRTDFSLIMRSGVDGVFADQPDLAVAVRDGG